MCSFLACGVFKEEATYLLSLTSIASSSFGLGIVKVKSVIIVEVTLENKLCTINKKHTLKLEDVPDNRVKKQTKHLYK